MVVVHHRKIATGAGKKSLRGKREYPRTAEITTIETSRNGPVLGDVCREWLPDPDDGRPYSKIVNCEV